MQPVWIAFPKIPWGSLGWRMGPGEDYWHSWVPWFKGLQQSERETYKIHWPEPEGWRDFYSFIETGSLPQWVREQQQKVTESAIPPQPGEVVIQGYHRVLWLIRHHFKRVRVDRTLDDESIAEIHEAPDGSLWRLSAHATRGGMHFTKVADSGA
jgi:hypothetical protein